MMEHSPVNPLMARLNELALERDAVAQLATDAHGVFWWQPGAAAIQSVRHSVLSQRPRSSARHAEAEWQALNHATVCIER